MKRPLLTMLTILIIVSCRESSPLTENEKAGIIADVRQTLDNYYNDIGKSGLIAEFKYLDNSSEFFWAPPGYSSSISYDSVVTVLKQNAPRYKSIDISFDTLRIIPLSETLATYTTRLHSNMTDTSGKVMTFSLMETGVLIKRQDGWKLLSGQTSILSQQSEKKSDSNQDKIDEVYSIMSIAYKTYDIKLIKKIYTDEAYTIYAGDTSSISHEKNIFASFQRTFDYHKQREVTLDIKFKIIERKVDTEMAYDIGYFRIDKSDKQGVKTIGKPGKFVTVLLKQRDGSWKFQVDIYGDASFAAFQ